MNKLTFLYFIFTQININKTKYVSIFIISTLLIALFSSFLFISSAISKDVKLLLNNQPDFILQRVIAGKVIDTPIQWADDLLSINGVSESVPRVYGKYFYEPAEHYFTIVGIDLFDNQVVSNLKELMKDLNIKSFMSKNNMIIGDGVREFFTEYQYFDYYNFRPPDKSIQKVYIYDDFPNESNIVSSDMIIMDINLAKRILGIEDEFCSDILFNVPNVDEHEMVINKIRTEHMFDIRILSQHDIQKGYIGFFNYKSSLFMMLYIIVLSTFILIIYQRYTYINGVDKKDIAILRSLGWSINQVIMLKIFENLIIFIFSYILGVNLGYIFVFILDAPLLKNIFLGFSNLSNNVEFIPVVDIGSLVLVFFFFIIPIIAAIIIPVWKISITEPIEAMR